MPFDVNDFFASLPREIDAEELKALVPADMWDEDAEKAAVLALRRSGKFDEDAYLDRYPDVRESDMDTIEHYIKYGGKEKRCFNIKCNKKIKYGIPKISVIIPIYNKSKYLRECLDSVLNQTLYEIEVICINDGSADNSFDILKEYAKKDFRILIFDQKNIGAAATRTRGMARATGEYISLIDADDFISCDFYELLYSKAKKDNADIVRGLYRISYGDYSCPTALNNIILEKNKKSEKLGVNDHSVVVCNAIYRTSFLRNNNIDYYDDIKSVHDVPFTARVTYFSKKTVPALGIYYYRQNVDGQLTVFTIDRFINTLKSNKITIDFINSVEYNCVDDYIVAFKRCLLRYHNLFIRSLREPFFSDNIKYELFIIMVDAYNKCRYHDMLTSNKHNEAFYVSLEENDYYKYQNKISSSNNLILDDVIISLTSYPKRINTVCKTIYSLLNQDVKASKIYLYLTHQEFPRKEIELPENLLELIPKGLIIKWTDNIGSYTKLIPALTEFPEKIIVTVDDDMVYNKKC